MGVPSTALPSRVFLTTRYSQPWARNSLRSLVSASTVSPRKSVITRLRARASFSLRLSMLVCLSVRFTANLLGRSAGLEIRHQGRRVDLQSGAHGGRQSDRPHIRPLGRGG